MQIDNQCSKYFISVHVNVELINYTYLLTRKPMRNYMKNDY